MRTLASLVVALACLAGCAQEPKYGYYSTYGVPGAPAQKLGPREAARAHIQGSNSKLEQLTSGEFDEPIRLIHAPQPTMPPLATENRIEGSVTVRLLFDEAGKVEKVFVDQSPSEVLTTAVLEAVREWQIQPATSKGVPVKFRLKQSFSFEAVW